MVHDYFEEIPLNDDASIDAYSKLTVVETTALKSNEISEYKTVNKTPKLIMVKINNHGEDFAANFERNCDPGFPIRNFLRLAKNKTKLNRN